MAYISGDSKQIIVGAAALFVGAAGGELNPGDLPDFVAGEGYAETLSGTPVVRNVGYTTNGLEIQFQPDFGEVQVDQTLDAAKMFKQGMSVTLRTAFAEATLENLLVAIAAGEGDLTTSSTVASPTDAEGGATEATILDLTSGRLGECPLERGIVAVGPGTGDCTAANGKERIYVAFRALSMDSVTVSAKRDSASTFEVSFRLLPNGVGSYGRIVDRVVGTTLP